MQTPFERLMGELTTLAQREPLTAFSRLQEAYNKSLSEADVQQLTTFATSLGGALGRWDDTITFLGTLLDHAALTPDGPVARSIWRATAVMQRCAGNEPKANEAIAQGVTNQGERCRVEVMTAQTLFGVGRFAEVAPYLHRTTEMVASVEDEDVCRQVMMICLNLARLLQQQISAARSLLHHVAETAKTAGLRGDDWRQHHQAHFHRSRSYLLAGRPREALGEVQAMIRLETLNDAGPTERFFSASAACHAQILRGQFKIAAGAYRACRELAEGIDDDRLRPQLEQSLKEMQTALDS